MKTSETIQCDQCNLLMINGVICHETGCPDHWKFILYSCDWCGTDFERENNLDKFCDESCRDSYFS